MQFDDSSNYMLPRTNIVAHLCKRVVLYLYEHTTACANEVLMEADFTAVPSNESATVRTLPSCAMLTLQALMLNFDLLHNPFFVCLFRLPV